MKSAIVGVLFCSSLLWAGSPKDKPPETLAITNVNIVDTREPAIHPNATVIIKDGKIVALVKIAVLDPGPHVRIVNGGGKYLIPGLWDMNVHLSGPAAAAWESKTLLALFLANGVTGVRDLRGAEVRVTGLRPEIVRGAGHPASGSARTLEDLNEVMLNCSSREQEFRNNGGHSLDDPEMVSREIRQSYDQHKAWDYFVDLSNQATWMVPGLVSVNPSIDSTETEQAHFLPSSLAISDSDEDEPDFQMAKRQEAARDLLLVHDMHRAGVQFLAGTNAPGINLLPGFSLHRELEMLVRSGFSPFEALQAATINPALYMAKLDKYGVVETGRAADLVLLDDNPLVDIRNIDKISAIVLHGEYLSREQLERVLARDHPVTTTKRSPTPQMPINSAIQHPVTRHPFGQ